MMDFEEIQVVWDSQREQPVYALDRDALHASVRRRSRRVELAVSATEIAITVIAGALALLLARKPLLEGTDRHELFGAALFLGVALSFVLLRTRRRRRAAGFEPSLLGDLERAIAQVDHHVLLARTFQWWFVLPALLVTLLELLDAPASKPPWLWIAAFGSLAACLWLVRKELRCVHLRRRRELQALRARLVRQD